MPSGPLRGLRGQICPKEADRHAEDPGLVTTPGLSGHPITWATCWIACLESGRVEFVGVIKLKILTMTSSNFFFKKNLSQYARCVIKLNIFFVHHQGTGHQDIMTYYDSNN